MSTTTDRKNILSIKIVSVDYYLNYPIKNLDVEYSEFRGSPVKFVSVIRIFGTTQNKKKICCNVHGAFPYFYIPCAETNPDRIQELMKDLAAGIDKSINISFGRSSSTNQHIYRISLVKGIPMYGYHTGEHQFLRIQLYNPNLLRRVSNLLQSGIILNKHFQPHESHIPYIQKFFIDYNLFGMSYLHVPMEFVHKRFIDDDPKFRKRSVSDLEVDIKAIHILNRLEIGDEESEKAANPGIESIWEDEKSRRLEMIAPPPLESSIFKVTEVPATESDTFYRNVLKDKLLKVQKSLNEVTFSDSTFSGDNSNGSWKKGKKIKKTFDINRLLETSSYAAELSQNSSMKSSQQSEMKSTDESQAIEDLENEFLNMSEVIDDDKLEADFMNMTEVYEDDSILAPLTQSSEVKIEEIEQFDESDDEMFNELNMTVADMEIFSQFDNEEEEEKIDQLDGVDDKFDGNISPAEFTRLQDIANNFFPQPGPSRLANVPARNQQNLEALDTSVVQENLAELAKKFTDKNELKSEELSDFYDEENEEDDEHFKSFYNQTMMADDFESESDQEQPNCDNIKSEISVISPALDPPDPAEVLEQLKVYDLLDHINAPPVYSNAKDITGKMDVGHHVLEIRGNRLIDLEEFKSQISNENQMEKWRIQKFRNNFGFSPKSSMVARNFMDSKTRMIISPFHDPPTYQDAANWLMEGSNPARKVEDESPVKEKRQKVLMVLEDDQEVKDEEDLDQTLVNKTPDNNGFNPNSNSNSDSNDYVPSSLEKETPNLSKFIEDETRIKNRRKRRKNRGSFSERFREILKSKVGMESQSSQQSNESASKESEETTISEKSLSKTSDQSMIVKNANLPEESVFMNSCDLTGPSLSDSFGFKMKLECLQSNNEHADLTILSMELHIQTRNEFKPSPEFDEISAIFYTVDGFYVDNQSKTLNGIITSAEKSNFHYKKSGVDVMMVKNEMEIFEMFFTKVREFDPDIFAGYEIETASWGYFIQRGFVLNMNLCNALSRMPQEKKDEKESAPKRFDEDELDRGDYYSEQKIPGRIMLDVWRLMKHEIALTSYTFENICYHVLHRRYPKHSFSLLSTLWIQPLKQWIVLDYYMERAKTLIEILNQLDLIGRTCELAKLFGIQFYEVLSRGSQFRVESMMIRIAKRRNYVPVSPSVEQRAHMRAPEYIPLVMEPHSRFYSDPVIVLDFQSLYPSIIIAYNYCFSTCIGRIEHLSAGSSAPFEFGAYQLRVSPKRLQDLIDNDLITISPCGVAYVKPEIREGVLPRMLREILDTRLMVKSSMKLHKSNSALQRVLHSRQLGLKLIANVTYGYTAANFSGRMPAIEVGDSVVSKGRETLERAIKMVEENQEWACKVCYGDTDSMFVMVPGRSKEEAFVIGEKIAEAVTNANPHPVKLKLEKVYQPCILQTKKRYVGSMYESPEQKEPTFEAKGIETVRRDGCPAASKILEKSLKILFETYDVSRVKEYVCRQFTKILAGKCSVQDLIFAKEFRGLHGYKERACVPALAMTRKWVEKDPRNEPRRGERVPFLIVNGAPNLPLIRLVRSPLEFLTDENYKINSIYYITKAIIPPLNRCLLLLGANAAEWFAELPKRQQFIPLISATKKRNKKVGIISKFFTTASCVTCDNQTRDKICENCRKNSQSTVLSLSEKIFSLERKSCGVKKICESCCKRDFDTECISLDCPVLYSLTQVERNVKQTLIYQEVLDSF